MCLETLTNRNPRRTTRYGNIILLNLTTKKSSNTELITKRHYMITTYKAEHVFLRQQLGKLAMYG